MRGSATIPQTTKTRFWADSSDPRHGTSNGYTNLGCRCARCTAAHAVYHRQSGAQDRYHDRYRGLPCTVPGCYRVIDLSSPRHRVCNHHRIRGYDNAEEE